MTSSRKTIEKPNNIVLANDIINKKIILELQMNGNLSDAEIKFLSLSNKKADSSEIINRIIESKITLENYEEVFYLKGYRSVGGTVDFNNAIRNIRYKDKNGVLVAVVQIDSVNKKIRMQNFGNILPIQEVFSPSQVLAKVKNLANYNSWIKEDGGINQFNGNTEYRYKDSDGNVRAAVITNTNGVIDMIAEYTYHNGIKTQMLVTNNMGQSRVLYDGSRKCIRETRIDIDADGLIVEITKTFS